MGFEDLATKEDIKRVESMIADKIAALSIPKQEFEKTGLTTQQVIKAYGGEVSPKYISGLRKDRIIHGEKIGGMWIYNYQSVMDSLPDNKKQ